MAIEAMSTFFFLAVGAVSLFTFIGVATWARERRVERVALYRAELLKKLSEQPGDGPRQVLELMREEAARKSLERRRGLLLGGMLACAVGLGLVALLGALPTGVELRPVGLIPFLVGLVLILFAWLGMKPPAPPPPNQGSPEEGPN
jgi:hypothetical protein